MTGYIKGRDVLWHSLIILREFGLRCYLCCLKAMLTAKRMTFLACALPRAMQHSAATSVR